MFTQTHTHTHPLTQQHESGYYDLCLWSQDLDTSGSFEKAQLGEKVKLCDTDPKSWSKHSNFFEVEKEEKIRVVLCINRSSSLGIIFCTKKRYIYIYIFFFLTRVPDTPALSTKRIAKIYPIE